MPFLRFFPFLLLFCVQLAAQPELDAYEDAVYREYIRSVKLTVNGLALSQPIVALGSMGSLQLSFDELDGPGTRYYYTVIHCNRHWQPTQELSQFDYLGGYREGEIRDYQISTNSYQNYLYYSVNLPNDELNWTISGNYLLVVYEAGYENDPILTRRFMVVDEKTRYTVDMRRPAQVDMQNTHQEIDFILDMSATGTQNPRMEISCTLLQNGRWDNALTDITPRLVNGMMLDYNYQGKIVFEAGKEFRNLDISSLIYRSENVLDIEEYPDGYSLILIPDEIRASQAYLWRQDLDGLFVPFNRDHFRKRIPQDSLASTLNLVNRFLNREMFLNIEYVDVLFTLNVREEMNQDIYIVGGMTDWKLLPEYRMVFDERIGAYVCRVHLKQGYYNYAYAIPKRDYTPDFTFLEGNWHDTENKYTLLVYFRPRSGQYDQLVGAYTFSSTK